MSICIDEDLSPKDAADARCEMGHSPVGNTSGDMSVVMFPEMFLR
jgi:hypothetical protein